MNLDHECVTILVVDDNLAIRAIAKTFLENAGYSVIAATDGEEGLGFFLQRQSSISLVLTDVMMPNMNGFDFADRVLEFDSRLPVLFMSGSTPDASRGYGCLPKPFNGAVLIDRVTEILRRRPPTLNAGAFPGLHDGGLRASC
jgi:DNA-binding response OmpR family regulator